MTNLQTQSTIYKELAEYYFTKDPKLAKVNDLEKAKFLRLCQINQLDPFKNEVYAIPFEVKWQTTLQIVINYKVYLERAEKSWDLNWWKVEIEMDKDNKWPTKWKIIIYRKWWDHPFEYEVDFDEASQWKHKSEYKNTWKDSPKFMLKKTLIKQWFQMAFPLEMDVDEDVAIEGVVIEWEINTPKNNINDTLQNIANWDFENEIKEPISDQQKEHIDDLLNIVPDFVLTGPTNFDEAEDYIIKIRREITKRIKSWELKPTEDWIKEIFWDDAGKVLDYLNK